MGFSNYLVLFSVVLFASDGIAQYNDKNRSRNAEELSPPISSTPYAPPRITVSPTQRERSFWDWFGVGRDAEEITEAVVDGIADQLIDEVCRPTSPKRYDNGGEDEISLPNRPDGGEADETSQDCESKARESLREEVCAPENTVVVPEVVIRWCEED